MHIWENRSGNPLFVKESVIFFKKMFQLQRRAKSASEPEQLITKQTALVCFS
jgi:hypothetical protein